MAGTLCKNGKAALGPDLPALGSLVSPDCTTKEKIHVVLRLLRQAAMERRGAKERPFYSIRAVARNFSLQPTTVTRLYGQLKTEGVLGSIWGSKTIIEPLEIDKDIRLKGIVGLPVALKSFSIRPGYRRFFRLLQQTLWKHRFGSQLVFYGNGFPESPKFTDILVDYRTDIAIWLTPSSGAANAVARLKDRGIRSIPIIDGLPINGEPGYYVSRQNAVAEGSGGLEYLWNQVGRNHLRSFINLSGRTSNGSSRAGGGRDSIDLPPDWAFRFEGRLIKNKRATCRSDICMAQSVVRFADKISPGY